MPIRMCKFAVPTGGGGQGGRGTGIRGAESGVEGAGIEGAGLRERSLERFGREIVFLQKILKTLPISQG